MSTDTKWLNLYPGKILGLQDLQDRLTDSLRQQTRELHQDVWGAGGTVGASPDFTIGTDVFSADGADLFAWTPAGDRVAIEPGTASWTDVPYEGNDASTYVIGAQRVDVPHRGEPGTDGQPGFDYYTEKVGRLMNPGTVTDIGTGLRLDCTASMFTGELWPGNSDTRPVIVWYADAFGRPASPGTEAVYTGTLVKNGSAYRVDTTHYFGQSSPSTTAARYFVALLGPEPATGARSAAAAFTDNNVILGHINAGPVYSAALAPVIGPVLSEVVFEAQHDSTTGAHKNITATSSGSYPVIASINDTAANNHQAGLEARNAAGNAKVQMIPGRSTQNNEGGILRFPRPDLSNNVTAMIDVGPYAGTSVLKITNTNAVGDEAVVEYDGILRRDGTKTGTQWAFEVASGITETLRIRNTGAGVADVRLEDGTLTIVDGDLVLLSGAIDVEQITGSFASWDLLNGILTTAEIIANGGIEVHPNGSTAAGVRYTTPVPFNLDLTPYKGGWIQSGGTGVPAYTTGTPPSVRSTTTDPIVLRRAIDVQVNEANFTEGTRVRFVSVEFRYLRANLADLFSVTLVSVARDGSGAPTTVATSSPAVSAVYAAVTLAINADADPDLYYYLQVSIEPDASAADVRIADVTLNIEKEAIE